MREGEILFRDNKEDREKEVIGRRWELVNNEFGNYVDGGVWLDGLLFMIGTMVEGDGCYLAWVDDGDLALS